MILTPVSAADSAAEQHNDVVKEGAAYTTVLYDRSSGLPTSEANAVLQTSDGFVWIGSYSGLVRYDGSEFYRFDSSVGISSVICLYEDSRQRLWIGTNDAGLAVYEDNEFKFYSREQGLRSASIRSICEDSAGNIYAATTFGLGYVDKDGNLNEISDAHLNGEYIKDLDSDSEGTVYGITSKGNLFVIKDCSVSAIYPNTNLTDSVINCVTADKQAPGAVYLGTEDSEIIYGSVNNDMSDPKKYSTAPLRHINRIFEYGDSLWICSDNGIGRFKDDMSYSSLYNLPIDDSIDNMMCDYEGNLWFASSRQGVLKIAPSQFMDLNMAAGIETGVVNTTCLNGNKLYIGTDSGLKVTDTENNPIDDPMCAMLDGVRIRCIKKDKNGNIWFCTFGEKGLVCLHPDGSTKTFGEADGFLSHRFRTAEMLDDGRIAVSCTGGAYIMDENGIIESYESKDGIGNSDILCIANGGSGTLYLGSDGDGIYKVNDGKIEHLGVENGLRSEVVLKIKRDEINGLYWIITSNSIAYMKDDKITCVTNFPYSNNFDIYPDNNGRMWVLSSNGIYVATVQSLINNTGSEYQFYDTKSGLPCVATVNSSSAEDENGRLYMAGGTGVVRIDLNTAEESYKNTKLTVPFVAADGVIYTVKNNTVTIPSNTRRLTVYDYVLTFSLKNPSVSYMLDGFDKEPYSLLKQDMEPVSYTNLKGGTYHFKLSVVDTFTGNAGDTLNITVIKEKALYEKLWFIITVILGALVLLGLAVHFYLKKKTAKLLKTQNEQKQYINEIIQAFAKCIDMKDKYTRGHSFRVAYYSRLLAEKMGYGRDDAEEVYNIALLHDIGKISIPDEILNEPGRATDEEYAILKSHSQNGYEILKDITIAPKLALGARFHHERPDGRGYPKGLTAEDIPPMAKIIAVADTFDAMYSNRPYRKQLELSVVVDELKRVAGTQLDPEVVDCMIKLVDEGKIGKRNMEE